MRNQRKTPLFEHTDYDDDTLSVYDKCQRPAKVSVIINEDATVYLGERHVRALIRSLQEWQEGTPNEDTYKVVHVTEDEAVIVDEGVSFLVATHFVRERGRDLPFGFYNVVKED